MAAALGAAAAAGRLGGGSGSSTFAGSAAAVSPCGAARLGDAEDQLALIAMSGVPRRPYKRICDRTHKDWLRGRRRNTAAKHRFLIKPDGTVWRKQGGLRHLKSKKTPRHLKRLAKMVRITKKEYLRVRVLTGHRIPIPKAADYIMRKFNEARAKKHLGTTDRHVGTAMWT